MSALNNVLIIAEAGVNHNGNLALAFELVDVAVKAGVDIIKFQTFKTEHLVTTDAKQADYQIANSQKKESQYAMLKKLELTYDEHLAVKAYCEEKKISYLSTAFDFESLNFLVHTMKLKQLKIPSGEITNAPFVLAHALSGCDLILSTGMATLAEIEYALSIIAFGFLQQLEKNIKKPSDSAFKASYQSAKGQALLKEKVVILHCTTEYPAPFNEVNLAAMSLLRQHFSLPVGYSDHTSGIEISLAAAAQGACLIEKHFTLDKALPGPDHQASIEPDELNALVSGVRNIELAIGQAIKQPTLSELKNITVARKSIFAKRAIKKGQKISADDLVIMRPGDGLSPLNYFQLIDSIAIKDFNSGETLAL